SVVPPAMRLDGVAEPTPDGGVEEATTVRLMVALPVRLCASVMVAGMDFAPRDALPETVVWNVKTLSPAVMSPCVPSSKNVCDAEPPIDVRSAETARPVLVGLLPGATFTVSVVGEPCATVDGFAAPTPEGFVGPLVTGASCTPRKSLLVPPVAI